MKSDLSTDGYTILQAFDSDTARKYFDEFLIWRARVKPTIPPHGVLKHYQIGHQPFMWRIRTAPNVYRPFQKILGETDLVVSFDGFGYLPLGTNRPNRPWHHIDQAPKDLSFQCVQGIVALTSNTNATFQCVPGSHKLVSAYFGKHPAKTPSKRWQKIDLKHFNETLDTNLETETISLAAGEMLIWDSRLIHQNAYDSAEERGVAYVSYRSRKGMSKSQGEKRLRAFEEKRSTSHWAYPLEVNSTQPQVWGDKSKLIDYGEVPEIRYSPELLCEIKRFL
jgi:ectoine hydroxylase-related dioxygenase (phytanoyl-CoA dioxygenase family)